MLTDEHDVSVLVNNITNARVDFRLNNTDVVRRSFSTEHQRTQRLEKCVDRTVLYGNITPKTPNGTFCAGPLAAALPLDLLEVLFIQMPVVMTKYMCDVVMVLLLVAVDPGPVLALSERSKKNKHFLGDRAEMNGFVKNQSLKLETSSVKNNK